MTEDEIKQSVRIVRVTRIESRPKMRISVDMDDAGYANFARYGYDTKVMFDGAEVRNCFTADEQTGEAIFADLDESGNVYVDRSGNAARVIRHGAVKIILPSEQ